MTFLVRPANLNSFAGDRNGWPLVAERHSWLLLTVALFFLTASASAQGQVACQRTFHDPERYVVHLAYDSKGERLYSLGFGGGRVLVWDPATGKLLKELQPSDGRRSGSFVSSGDSLALIIFEKRGPQDTKLEDGQDPKADKQGKKKVSKTEPEKSALWLWNSTEQSPYKQIAKDVIPVAASADGKLLVTMDMNRSVVKFWSQYQSDAVGQMSLASWKKPMLAMNAGGTVLAVGDASGKVGIYDVKTRKLLRTLSPVDPRDGVSVLALSPDGQWLAVLLLGHNGGGGTNLDERLVAYDLKSGRKTIEVKSSAGRLGLAFSPDGKMIAVGGGRARLLSTETGKQLALLDKQGQATWTVAFSPDGKTLATGGIDKSIKIWDVSGVNP